MCLVYTKTVDSVFRALWLATESVNILHYSLIQLQVPPSEQRQTRASCEQNVFPVCCRNKQRNSQLIKQAVPEVHKEGEEARFGSFKVARLDFLRGIPPKFEH